LRYNEGQAKMIEEEQEQEDAQYDPAFYGRREWFEEFAWQHRWIEFMCGWWVGEFGKPSSVLDFGCGDGHWLKAFHDIGVGTVCGVELWPIANEFVTDAAQLFIHDLRKPLNLGKKAELVICIEVAEHLSKQDGDTLCETIVQHMDNVLLFSAAGLRQQGTGHINLQSEDYWVKRIEEQGAIKYSPMKTSKVRSAFGKILNECYEFLPKNVLVFARI